MTKSNSVKGSIRYMVHKDNPEKFQYNWDEIVPHGGADLNSLCMPTSAERMKFLKEIFEFITENEVTEFADFINMCIALGQDEWFYLATQNSTIVIVNYISSRRYRGRNEE